MPQKDPVIHLRKEISVITVFRGETLTVYLQSESKHGEPENREQVELRVTPDGKFEMFADGLAAKPFSEWYNIP